MVPIGVECGMNEVLQRGKKLFFPDGMSSKGHESGFNFELRDYKQNPVQQDLTVGFIYDTLCMARLRFYIATTAKVIAIEDEDEEVTFGPGSPGGDIDGGDDDDTEPFEFVFELQPSPGSSSSFLVMDAPPDELLSTVSHDASLAQPSPVSHDASSAQPSPVSHDAHTLPQILEEIAHKDLIQKPRYVMDCWKEVTKGMIGIDELWAHYEAIKPTPRRVQGLLEFEQVTTAKQQEV
ncbi:uncharacterized protein LOC118562359, partial [Scomber scombrus]